MLRDFFKKYRAFRRLAFSSLLTTIAWSAATQRTDGDGLGKPLSISSTSRNDPRAKVDIHSIPWRAVGKLQATVGGLKTTCTGSLVGTQTVLKGLFGITDGEVTPLLLPVSLAAP